MPKSLKFKLTVNAPAAEVYRAFTQSMVLREWFCHAAQADARQGGRLYLHWNGGYYAAGEFTALVPHKKVAFTWHGRGEPGTTRVNVNLVEKNNRTVVNLTHAGIGAGKVWTKAVKEFERGWRNAIENLQSVLETGQDLRFTRRPMLGILVGSFNSDDAKRLNVPMTQGVRLDSVVDGLGAQKAGLQKDDVIVKMGKQKITGFGSLPELLQHYRAGDKIPVVFYRNGKKKTVTMELGARRLPEIPPTARGLADAVRKLYDEQNAELDQLMNGVSEAEASFKPSPKDWSAKETLAHLVAGERQNLSQMYDMMFDAERAYDTADNLDNLPEMLSATAQAYTAAELVREFKHNQAETVAMIAALPASFVAHKGTYWRMAFGFLQPLDHTRGHFRQMREAIQAARKK